MGRTATKSAQKGHLELTVYNPVPVAAPPATGSLGSASVCRVEQDLTVAELAPLAAGEWAARRSAWSVRTTPAVTLPRVPACVHLDMLAVAARMCVQLAGLGRAAR